tara:strand:- start:123 stop:500 length:378 start_codon:yes stop_codon:yes gene_type:complete
MSLVCIAGFGFRSLANINSLVNALNKAADKHKISGFSVPEDKVEHPALKALAKKYELPVYAVSEEVIKSVETITQSEVVIEKRQTGSVAESAALALFHGSAKLLGPRQISDDGLAVCAVAEGEGI